MFEYPAIGDPIVLEPRPDNRVAILEVLDFVMVPIDIAQLQYEALHGSRKIRQAPGHPEAFPAALEGDSLKFLLVMFLFVVILVVVFVLALFVVVIVVIMVIVVVVFLLMAVRVELLGKGNSEIATVDPRFSTDEHRLPVPAEPAAPIRHLRTRIEDLAFSRSRVVSRANPSAVTPEHHVSDPKLEARVSSR